MNIKLILIHMIDMFDNYVLHNILDRIWNHQWFDSLQNFHMKICEKICMSNWWG